MNWEEVSAELVKPLDPKHIKPAPKGKFGDYVDAHHVIEEANRIFGHDGWSYTVTRLAMVSEQTVTLNGSNGPYEQYRVGYMATVQVVVDGVAREGAAVGSGMGSPNSIADHHESAVKEAETDALKRGLRSFGNTFGLALYDKTKANIGDPDAPPPFNSAAARDRIKGRIEKAITLPDIEAIWSEEKETMQIVDEPHFNELKTAFSEKKAKLTPPDPAMQAPENPAQYQ